MHHFSFLSGHGNKKRQPATYPEMTMLAFSNFGLLQQNLIDEKRTLSFTPQKINLTSTVHCELFIVSSQPSTSLAFLHIQSTAYFLIRTTYTVKTTWQIDQFAFIFWSHVSKLLSLMHTFILVWTPVETFKDVKDRCPLKKGSRASAA